MKKEAVAAVLADAFQQRDSVYADEIRQIESRRQEFVQSITKFIDKLDSAEKDNWKMIVAAALQAGVTEGEIQQELGASPSTIHRWVQDGVAPKEGTRRLMKGALLDLVNRRASQLQGA